MYSKKSSDWVKELLPEVSKPIHMQMNFFLAQELSGVGCFRSYLHKLGKVNSPGCPCGHEKQTAEHILKKCLDHSIGRPAALDVSTAETCIYIEKTIKSLRKSEKDVKRRKRI